MINFLNIRMQFNEIKFPSTKQTIFYSLEFQHIFTEINLAKAHCHVIWNTVAI